ncbi:hypothetical protein FRC07_013269, partial [Ceratobasidium sp. 392]
MRKTPYLISLAVAFIALTLTILSIALPKWLRVPSPNHPDDLSYTGLYERCQLRSTIPPPPYPDPSPLPDPSLPPPPGGSPAVPPEAQSYSDFLAYKFHGYIPPPITDPSQPSNPTLPPKKDKKNKDKYRPKYKCHPFPSRTMCDHDGQSFCILWDTAGYAMQMSVVFAVIALIALSI